jgi:hypothetical protein
VRSDGEIQTSVQERESERFTKTNLLFQNTCPLHSQCRLRSLSCEHRDKQPSHLTYVCMHACIHTHTHTHNDNDNDDDDDNHSRSSLYYIVWRVHHYYVRHFRRQTITQMCQIISPLMCLEIYVIMRHLLSYIIIHTHTHHIYIYIKICIWLCTHTHTHMMHAYNLPLSPRTHTCQHLQSPGTCRRDNRRRKRSLSALSNSSTSLRRNWCRR